MTSSNVLVMPIDASPAHIYWASQALQDIGLCGEPYAESEGPVVLCKRPDTHKQDRHGWDIIRDLRLGIGLGL